MRLNFASFIKKYFRDFLEAIGNIILFLPYFFSVQKLASTFFSPWKNLVSKKTKPGFSFNDIFERFSFNLISRGIGSFMRFSILVFYIILQVVFFIALPFIFIGFMILLPIFYVQYLINKTEEENKEQWKNIFIQKHLLKQEHYSQVESWFEQMYQTQYVKSRWWKLSNLFTIPPIGRDWSVGFTPTLDEYTQDLCSTSYQSVRKNIIGRQKEINEMERALLKTTDSNILLIGEEGVGKHTVIDLFAKKLYEGTCNHLLMYERILKVNMEKILTVYTDIKQRESFFEDLLQEATDAKNIILLFDNFDTYISSGENRLNLTSSFLKYAKESYVYIVGILTPFAYQKYVYSNDQIRRLFNPIMINEVSQEEALQILLITAFSFEKRYQVCIPYETIVEVIEKSEFYITEIPFPEKAIELLDRICVYARQVIKTLTVLPEIVNRVISEKVHVPTQLSIQLKEKLLHLETELNKEIIDQPEAINKLSSTLQNSFLLMGKRKKPLASFLFLGPTGVGKTQTAKSLSRIFFGSEKYIIRFDMSNYQMKEDIPILIGSVETKEPGILTQKIREQPYGVLLLDEIEKANKDLLNIFLTIFDEAYFTDGSGKRVDCKSLVIIATSNAGDDYENVFLPEFLNRFDGIVIYRPLTRNSMLKIATDIVQQITNDIYKLHTVKLNVTQPYLEALIQKHYDQKYGVRNIQRIIREEIETVVARQILENKAHENDIITL
jgi:ATP-dependent Clp protease ATP-binding subunit ClpC